MVIQPIVIMNCSQMIRGYVLYFSIKIVYVAMQLFRAMVLCVLLSDIEGTIQFN